MPASRPAPPAASSTTDPPGMPDSGGRGNRRERAPFPRPDVGSIGLTTIPRRRGGRRYVPTSDGRCVAPPRERPARRRARARREPAAGTPAHRPTRRCAGRASHGARCTTSRASGARCRVGGRARTPSTVARRPPGTRVPARHRGSAGDRRARRGPLPLPAPGLHGWFVGVDVFFVLSGFLITRLVLGELVGTGTISLRRFWGRRARRLLPASAPVVVVTAPLAAGAPAAATPRARRRPTRRRGDVHGQLPLRRPLRRLLRRPARRSRTRRRCCTSGRSPSRSSSTSAGRRCCSCSPAGRASTGGSC